MSRKWVAMGHPRIMRCPPQSEKASLPLFLTQSLLEVEAGSSGGIKGLIWKGPHTHTPRVVNGKPDNAYF